jgi:hypothetical protein
LFREAPRFRSVLCIQLVSLHSIERETFDPITLIHGRGSGGVGLFSLAQSRLLPSHFAVFCNCYNIHPVDFGLLGCDFVWSCRWLPGPVG